MSHITTVTAELKDVKAIAAACAELGLTFVENETTYKGWGKTKLECAHAIRLPVDYVNGRHLEIGLIKTETGYSLAYDHFLENNFGSKTSFIGKGASKLLQLYAVHKATIEAKRRGLIVTRKTVPGTQRIQLVCTGM